jgi:threonine dehydratase
VKKTQNNHSINVNPAQLIRMIADAQVYDVAQVSPMTYARLLSERLGNHIWMKREDQQSVFSFKLRGAYNKIRNLTQEQRQAGIIAASAGNHAQGVALAAQRLNIDAQIIMPLTTPRIKVDSVRALAADVVLAGDNYDEACEHAYQVAEESGRIFIHPYDDIEVIAGQGTVGKEIIEQFDGKIDAIFVPAGGGGLIAGVATWVKHYSPQTKIIGVEPEDAATLHVAMEAGKRTMLSQVGIFADGVAVKQIGEVTFEVVKDLVDEVILLTVDEICAAIKDIFDETRVVSEPAGALSVAGIKKYVHEKQCKELNLVAINSGANINFDRLRHVTERTEFSEGREGLLAVTIPEVKGSFYRFCETIGKHSLSEFNYRYADSNDAHIFVGIKFDNEEKDKRMLIDALESKGYPVIDLSNNEMAKLHLRHMVGGRSPQLQDELLYRFEFPERPGALLQFLSLMGSQWNISLFHYRNHGAAYGRVLVGIQVPKEQRSQFSEFLQQLGFVYYDETENPVYPLFLK